MPVATVTFRRCVVNSQAYGSDEEHVGSRIFFDLNINEMVLVNIYVDVCQLVGDGAENESLLISRSEGYDGPLDFSVFQRLVEFYYRQVVGTRWSMFGNQNTRMHLEEWVLEHEMMVQFEVPDKEGPIEVG